MAQQKIAVSRGQHVAEDYGLMGADDYAGAIKACAFDVVRAGGGAAEGVAGNSAMAANETDTGEYVQIAGPYCYVDSAYQHHDTMSSEDGAKNQK